MSYSENREWSDRYLRQIGAIVGPHLLGVSSFKVDTEQATDLITVSAKGTSIACRIRRDGYRDRYKYDFTIRAKTVSGARTEIHKLIDGHADWMFYGHAGPDDVVHGWWLIDLDAWRAAMVRHRPIREAAKPSKILNNADGSGFLAFDLRQFPEEPSILVDAHDMPDFISAREQAQGGSIAA